MSTPAVIGQDRPVGDRRALLQGAGRTLGTLFGGLIVGLLIGDLTFRLIPGSSIENVQVGHAVIAAIPALIGFLGGGAAWGVFMGRLAGSQEQRRMGLAGMLGFAPATILVAGVLGVAEPAIVASFDGSLPIHRIFTLLFVPAAFLIAGLSAFAVGRGLRAPRLARAMLWQVGLAAAAAFLVINLVMESLGWIVGAPGAAARATMLTVLALGNIGAAIVAGAWMGRCLATGGGADRPGD